MEIKKAIRLLGPLMVEGVLSVRNNSHVRLVEMLHQLDFITRSITKTADQIIIKLQILDVEPFYNLLAGEANKFLLASRISHERSTQEQLNNASWQTIENYYAAYYSIHYLLRVTGISVTNLDTRGTRSIERSSYGTPVAFPVPAGLYIIKFDSSTKELTLTKNLKKNGGSHQDAWQLWAGLIDKLRMQTNIDPIEYADLSIDLAEHKNFLIKSTLKYNPPEIRGEINYQFRGGTWIFEKNSGRSIGILQRAIAGTESSSSSVLATPKGLIANNKIII
ncbi:DNA/RNA non-specific endonuclease [Acidithiobacillus thiooxidans]|uniref:hypothetical protein n=1 Tax=Acidithiobacillus TaxID=119977 RepID=UPI00187ADEC3|nr:MULTISPECIES: hypothetical protein [Acidithiobacillus]MBE7567047.1 hypothetical protein [Acidithiobacillus sp. HP-11]MBU2750804.1 DNA/RNA non-specific endonuclease [Acidithiobacillus thiooxidans]MBU2792863.1 DNA/RNA non-specific endonuclease [Acidithiobacillus thiooxidans]